VLTAAATPVQPGREGDASSTPRPKVLSNKTFYDVPDGGRNVTTLTSLGLGDDELRRESSGSLSVLSGPGWRRTVAMTKNRPDHVLGAARRLPKHDEVVMFVLV